MKKRVHSIVKKVKLKLSGKNIDSSKRTHINENDLHKFHTDIQNIKKELSKVVVGQEKVVDSILRAVVSNGHVLLEGVPGIAKTLIMRAISQVMGCKTKRVQFTADLLPSDITGITSYDRSKGFYVIKGPIFTNFMLAYEINRAPAKVQSALLEAMQEKQVTIVRETFNIEHPFFVLATLNPIKKEENEILEKNITVKTFSDFGLRSVIGPLDILRMQQMVQKIYVSDEVREYIVRLIDSTRNPAKYNLKNSRYIRYGSSPRASISLYIGAKADALLNGKDYITPQNVKDVAHDVLRHRLLLNYEGQAENIDKDEVINEILAKVPVP